MWKFVTDTGLKYLSGVTCEKTATCFREFTFLAKMPECAWTTARGDWWGSRLRRLMFADISTWCEAVKRRFAWAASAWHHWISGSVRDWSRQFPFHIHGWVHHLTTHVSDAMVNTPTASSSLKDVECVAVARLRKSITVLHDYVKAWFTFCQSICNGLYSSIKRDFLGRSSVVLPCNQETNLGHTIPGQAHHLIQSVTFTTSGEHATEASFSLVFHFDIHLCPFALLECRQWMLP